MTAKEMFEELGYKQTINNDVFIEYRNGDSDYVYIIFNLIFKEYEVGYFVGYCGITVTTTSIKEHKAITKQMKELGWI